MEFTPPVSRGARVTVIYFESGKGRSDSPSSSGWWCSSKVMLLIVWLTLVFKVDKRHLLLLIDCTDSATSLNDFSVHYVLVVKIRLLKYDWLS